MNISYNGIGELVVTFPTKDTNIKKGSLIIFDAENSGYVKAGYDIENNTFVGIAASDYRNDIVAVQIKGYMEYEFKNPISIGMHKVIPDGDNFADCYGTDLNFDNESMSRGRDIMVIKTDGSKAGFILF